MNNNENNSKFVEDLKQKMILTQKIIKIEGALVGYNVVVMNNIDNFSISDYKDSKIIISEDKIEELFEIINDIIEKNDKKLKYESDIIERLLYNFYYYNKSIGKYPNKDKIKQWLDLICFMSYKIKFIDKRIMNDDFMFADDIFVFNTYDARAKQIEWDLHFKPFNKDNEQKDNIQFNKILDKKLYSTGKNKNIAPYLNKMIKINTFLEGINEKEYIRYIYTKNDLFNIIDTIIYEINKPEDIKIYYKSK